MIPLKTERGLQMKKIYLALFIMMCLTSTACGLEIRNDDLTNVLIANSTTMYMENKMYIDARTSWVAITTLSLVCAVASQGEENFNFINELLSWQGGYFLAHLKFDFSL